MRSIRGGDTVATTDARVAGIGGGTGRDGRLVVVLRFQTADGEALLAIPPDHAESLVDGLPRVLEALKAGTADPEPPPGFSRPKAVH